MAWIGGLALVYFLVAALSLTFEFDEGIAVICVPAGLFLPALLLTRRDLRVPLAAVLTLAHVFAELSTGTPLIGSMGYAVSMMLDATLAVWLLDRRLKGTLNLSRVSHAVTWFIGSVVLSNGLASLVAAATATQLPEARPFGAAWARWASSDGVANLLLTPFVLSWFDRLHYRQFRPKRLIEGLLLVVCVVLLSYGLFVRFEASEWVHLVLPYAVVPFVLWAALRFETRGVSTLLVALASVAIPLTYGGRLVAGAVGIGIGMRDQVVVVQLVLAVLAVPALVLAALVSERRESDVERAESEHLFSSLFRDSPTAMVLVDLSDRRYVDVNEAFLRLSGHRRDAVIGRTPTDIGLIAEADDERRVRDMIMSGGVVGAPIKIKRVDGEIRHTLLSANAISLQGGHFLLATIQDVTESVRVEQALRHSEKRLQDITFSLAEWVWETDANGVYTYGSYRGRELFGDVIGKTPFDFMPPAEAARIGPIFADILARKAPFRDLENWNITKDGERVCLLTSGVPMLGPDGQLLGYRGVDKDITEIKRAEEQQEILEGRLQQSQKMESVGRLAGGVAHDFNNMLGVILGHTELASFDAGVTPAVREHLQAIEGAATRSAGLTRQLLAFARKQSITPKVVDLNDIVSASLKLLRRLISEDINLEWRPGATIWPVKIDPSQVDQMLANLCVNARDAIAGAGSIRIATHHVSVAGSDVMLYPDRTPGDYVVLTVSDNGQGMTDEVKAHLFEPLFTTKPLGAGTGLGLSSVYGAVTQNGGFVTVESEVGRGTTIAVHLPRTSQAASADVAHDRTGHRGAETILVVEDERALLRMTQQVLQSRGYRVLAASSAEEAFQVAGEAGVIDLLLTDVIMPGDHGLNLAERLAPVGGRMKRLFMSGYTADVIASRGEIPSGTAFIEKPFTSDQLAAKVRQVLDTAS